MISKLLEGLDFNDNINQITDEEFKENIRINLERLRTLENLSQENFAKEIGVSPSHYKRLIRGETSLGASCTFKALYIKYGLMLHELGLTWDRALRIRTKISMLDNEQLAFIESIVDREIENNKKTEE